MTMAHAPEDGFPVGEEAGDPGAAFALAVQALAGAPSSQ